MQKPFENIVYSKNVIEFVTVAREYCTFMENTPQYAKVDFFQVGTKLLPLLYIKASLLPNVAPMLDEPVDAAVDEFTYTRIREGIAQKLTSHDDYLEVFHEDMQRSETPILSHISEDLADIYQDLRNFTSAYRIGVDEIMNDALYEVTQQFKLYWGQRLVNALRALHNALYSGDELKDVEPVDQDDPLTPSKENKWFSRFQDEWGNDSF